MISLKMDQLKNVLYETNKRKYKINDESELNDITQKYIEKIFPSTHIVTMPELLTEVEKEQGTYNGYPIEKYIFKHIFDTTGYKLVKPTFGVSSIVPKSLREMNVFIHFIESLKPTNIQDEKYDNTKKFVEYYINTILKVSLKNQDYNFIINLYNNRYTNVNLMIIKFLIGKLYTDYDEKIINKLDIIKEINDYKNEIENIIDIGENSSQCRNLRFIQKNIAYDISEANINLGKVLRIFKICENYFIQEYDKKLLEYLKFIYSIMMYISCFNENNDRMRITDFIGKNMYGDWEDMYDIKNYLFKLKTMVTIINEESVNDIYTYKDIRSIDKTQNVDLELYKMKYLLNNTINPVIPENEDLFILREDDIDSYNAKGTQKNFYYDGTMLLTNLFYCSNIFDFIDNNIKNNNEINKFKSQVQQDIDKIIECIPFYNLEFLMLIFDRQVKEANKARVKGDNLIEFTCNFIEKLNTLINNIMIKSNSIKEGVYIYNYKESILLKLPAYKLLKNFYVSDVINNLNIYDYKKIVKKRNN